MTKETLAVALDGTEYPLRVSREVQAEAKEAGLVIVYGASDDLLEMRGAIEDELSAWEGTTILVTPAGLWDEQSCERQCCHYQQAQAEAVRQGATITAVWDLPGKSVSWCYETTIPHATLLILEDGEPYCRGLVFALADVGR